MAKQWKNDQDTIKKKLIAINSTYQTKKFPLEKLQVQDKSLFDTLNNLYVLYDTIVIFADDMQKSAFSLSSFADRAKIVNNTLKIINIGEMRLAGYIQNSHDALQQKIDAVKETKLQKLTYNRKEKNIITSISIEILKNNNLHNPYDELLNLGSYHNIESWKKKMISMISLHNYSNQKDDDIFWHSMKVTYDNKMKITHDHENPTVVAFFTNQANNYDNIIKEKEEAAELLTNNIKITDCAMNEVSVIE